MVTTFILRFVKTREKVLYKTTKLMIYLAQVASGYHTCFVET